MTRNVLMVYLKNLRDLEVAKYQLTANYNSGQKRCNNEIASINKEIAITKQEHYEVIPEPPKGRYVLFGCCLIIALFVFYFAIPTNAERYQEDASMMRLFSIMSFVLSLCFYPWSYASKKKKAIAHNEAEKRRLEQSVTEVKGKEALIQSKKAALTVRNNGINLEYKKICGLLQDAYNLNVIPSQYRNLASVYYIYDYMSSSQASLEETLLHEHMESGNSE